MDVILGCLLLSLSGFHLSKLNGNLYLVNATEQTQIEGLRYQDAKVGSHVVQFGDHMATLVDGKKLDTRDLIKSWLQDDDKWGGHQSANQFRYMDQGGGGISAYLTQLVPQPNGTGLGVLNMRFDGPSGEPLGGQILVQFSNSRFDFIRFLSTPDEAALNSVCPLRILQSSKGPLIWDKGQFLKLDKSGNVGSKIMDAPAGFPVAVLEGRYAIVKHPNHEGSDIDSFDLQRFTTRRVFQETETSFGGLSYLAYIPEKGNYLLMARQIDKNGGIALFTLRVPDGRRTPMPPQTSVTWGRFAIIVEEKKVTVFRADSGQKVVEITNPSSTSDVPAK